MQTTTADNQSALAAIDRGLSRIHPHLWASNRMRTLKAEAHAMRAGINVAKTSSLAGTMVAGGAGLLLGGTGVALIGCGIGLLSYAAVLLCDGIDTGRFAPLPFIRTRLGDRLETLGSADTRVLRQQYDTARAGAGIANFEADEELYSNLPAELCHEALMLRKHGALVVRLLNGVEPAQRDLAYLHLCNAYETFGDALTGMTADRLRDGLQGQINGDYQRMRPAEIHEYQPPTYQMPEAAQSFGELPTEGDRTRLTAVAVPVESDSAIAPTEPKLQQSYDHEPQDFVTSNDLALIKQAIGFPAVLVFGPAGSGKSTMVKWLTQELSGLSHQLEVLDPHKAYGDWPGLQCYGAGNNLEECDSWLKTFIDRVNSRYRQRANKPSYNPRPYSLVVEEFTKWSDACAHAAEFFTCSISDIRKVNMGVVYVSHANTLQGLGGAKGMAKSRDNGLIQIELFAKQGPDNQPVPAGKGRITFPGQKAVDIRLPDFRMLMRSHKAEERHTDQPVHQMKAATVTAQTMTVHPKVQRFAEVVSDWFEKHPGRTTVGLSQIINSNTKLKKLRADGRKAAIERLVAAAVAAELLRAESGDSGWTIHNPVATQLARQSDDYDFDF